MHQQKDADEDKMRLLRKSRTAMQEELRPLLVQQAQVAEDTKETGPVRCVGARGCDELGASTR